MKQIVVPVRPAGQSGIDSLSDEGTPMGAASDHL